VCNSNPAVDATTVDATGGDCCGPAPVAIAAPALLPVAGTGGGEQAGGGCCG
jgi:hypothetical protein